MHRFGSGCRFVALCVAVMCLLSSPVAAGELDAGGATAVATARAGGVSWQVETDYAQAVLTVAGPGSTVVRREFGAGEPIILDLSDREISAMGDGQFTWELRFAPVVNDLQIQALAKVRAAGDPAAGEALKIEGAVPPAIAAASGYFRVEAGSVVVALAEEPTPRSPSSRLTPAVDAPAPAASDDDAATKDQVILDDLIVDGSLCVGFDCINGESFGFDTLRLKENNVRIKFDDTSNSASFPFTDWQLTANDSTNGGANKFSIDDVTNSRTPFTIEASSPNHSLYVDDFGRVGFGTSTPVGQLHTNYGNTPTLRLEQNSSFGWSAQTWDVAGNEANFFIRDVTNGSRLPFRIRPGAPTSSIDISAVGNVGINTQSPSDRLHVVGGDLRIERTSAGTADHAALYLEQSGAATKSEFLIRANATTGALEIKDATAAATALKFQSGAANNSIVVATGVDGQPRVGIGDTTPSGTLDVAGTIFLSGTQVHPDFVFGPDYELESIEEHAASMWANGHLPAVGPGEYDENGLARFELGRGYVGILEELEKAHIYIEQLNSEVKALRSKDERLPSAALTAEVEALRQDKRQLETRNRELEGELEALEARMSQIERLLAASEDPAPQD